MPDLHERYADRSNRYTGKPVGANQKSRFVPSPFKNLYTYFSGEYYSRLTRQAFQKQVLLRLKTALLCFEDC